MVKRIIKKIFFSKLSRKREEEFLKKYSSGLKTLEIGAKSRVNVQYFSNLVTLNIEVGKEIDIVADAENLEGIIKDQSFDLILCISVLEHTKHPMKIVENIKRILKKDGMVIVSVPFIMSLHDTPGDYWRFTRYGLLELFEGFELLEIKDYMNSLETIGYLYHRLFLQTKGFTKISNLFFFFLSKVNYFLSKIIKNKEFGHFFTYKEKRQEINILTTNIMAVFRK
jgi:ubiquinone/menaquinone biosynthesis C-methylase UbiE